MAKFCQNCGKEIEEGKAFCANCGAPADGEQAAAQPAQAAAPAGAQPKSKMVAGLLGIFLGAWGIHNFYLGNSSRGIIQIVVTIVTCGVGGIWGFIEGILILCGNINVDANGNPLGD